MNLQQYRSEFLKEAQKEYNSRSSSHCLHEGVVYPSEYLKDIEEKLNKLKLYKSSKLSSKTIINNFNFKVSIYKIKFIFEDFVNGNPNNNEFLKYGVNSGELIPDKNLVIQIRLNPNVLNICGNENFYSIFIKWLKIILQHELVHRGQFLRIKDIKIRSKVMRVNDESDVIYLANKQEIMAWAWEILEVFKLKNYTTEEIKDILKTSRINRKYDNFFLKAYLRAFRKDSPEINLLYKYMYSYLLEDESV